MNWVALLISVTFAGNAFSSGGLNVYHSVEHVLGLGEHSVVLLSSLLTLVLTVILGLWYSGRVAKEDVKPSGQAGLRFFVESALAVVYDIGQSQCGKEFQRFLPPLAAIFCFVLITNLVGLIPGFPPSTGNFSANLTVGLFSFLVYNWAGIREHGVSYVKQFWGPVMAIGPLFFCLEIISHLGRPLSLGLRLSANIFGDHLLLDVFSNLLPYYVIGITSVLMLFGLLVACVQSFVFSLLTAIYINLAISHDH